MPTFVELETAMRGAGIDCGLYKSLKLQKNNLTERVEDVSWGALTQRKEQKIIRHLNTPLSPMHVDLLRSKNMPLAFMWSCLQLSLLAQRPQLFISKANELK